MLVVFFASAIAGGLVMTGQYDRGRAVAERAIVLAGESGVVHLRELDLPVQREQLVLDAAGVVRLGEKLASGVQAVVVDGQLR